MAYRGGPNQQNSRTKITIFHYRIQFWWK